MKNSMNFPIQWSELLRHEPFFSLWSRRLRTILTESEGKLEMKNFKPPSSFCVEVGYQKQQCLDWRMHRCHGNQPLMF